MTLDEMGWKVAGSIGGLWLGAVSWIVGKTENRIGALEKGKADSSSLDKIMERMEKRTDVIFEKLDTMQSDITQTRIDVAGLKR